MMEAYSVPWAPVTRARTREAQQAPQRIESKNEAWNLLEAREHSASGVI
jgi:hypothetical protein